jgi:hypothetical protein
VKHHEEFGGLQLRLKLPEVHREDPEPLFEIGRQPDQRDWLQIEFTAADRARLSFFQAGVGAFESAEFAIPADRLITVEADCGSFFPPYGFPLFSDWTRDEFDIARRKLQIKVNGVEVLRTALDCYQGSPSNLSIGRLEWFTGGMQQAFSGEVLGVRRLPLVRPEKVSPLFTSAAPIELKLYLPTGKRSGAEPLLLTGIHDTSDLLYCIYDGSNRVKFCLDHWGAGGPLSEGVDYNPLEPHFVTVWMGSMAGSAFGRLVLLFDGKPLLNVEQVFYPSSPETVVLGYNQFGSTAAERQFTGQIVGSKQVPLESLPPLGRSGSFGAVEMSVVFPLNAIGTNEPLVVTGITGKGDFIYVMYTDANHITLGYDHWAVGGIVGKPMEIDYGETHHLSITMGSLYPPGSDQRWSRIERVLVDGKTALDVEMPAYPSASDQIRIGKNPIGGSTCGPQFTGQILSIERSPAPRS